MNTKIILSILLIFLAGKVNSYDDTNGLIATLSENKTEGGLSMFKGNENHYNYFIILKNHGIKNKATFNFKIIWDRENNRCHNEDNWSKIQIYKMKTELPEVLNEYHFDEYKEGNPIKYNINYEYNNKGSNFQGVNFTIFSLNPDNSYFIQVPLVLYYPDSIHYDFRYEILEEEEKSGNHSKMIKSFSLILLIILTIL